MIRPLRIGGAWLIESPIHESPGRVFVDICRTADLPERFTPTELAVSVSAGGMVRGIHFNPEQAKVVTCVQGAVWDVAVDLRPGSATYGTWDSVLLNDDTRRSVYLSPGMGHGFCVLSDQATIVYAMDPVHDDATNREVHPFDPDLDISWPVVGDGALTVRDRTAPALADLYRVAS